MSGPSQTSNPRRKRSQENRLAIVAALMRRAQMGPDYLPEELARELNISRTNLRHHVDRLAVEGVLEIYPSTVEVPCTRIRLIPAGGV